MCFMFVGVWANFKKMTRQKLGNYLILFVIFGLHFVYTCIVLRKKRKNGESHRRTAENIYII